MFLITSLLVCFESVQFPLVRGEFFTQLRDMEVELPLCRLELLPFPCELRLDLYN